MRILVSGSAGFIGFHLANKLIARGDEVVGLDCINDYYDPNVKYGRLDYAGIDLIEKTVRGACRKVREGLHHVPWVTDTEMDHGLDGGEVL